MSDLQTARCVEHYDGRACRAGEPLWNRSSQKAQKALLVDAAKRVDGVSRPDPHAIRGEFLYERLPCQHDATAGGSLHGLYQARRLTIDAAPAARAH